MKICVLVPAYNEARTIGQVISAVREMTKSVIVIDDGSRDATAQLAQDAGAIVIKHQVNKGKGAALQTGFKYVLDNGYDAVITMDSDGQHDANDIPAFLEAFNKKLFFPSRFHGNYPGIIIGTRMNDISKMPTVRKFTNKLTSFVGSMLARQKLSDSQSGFRLISSDVLKTVQLETSGFEMESELLIKASKAGFRIVSVPIKTIYGREISKINPKKDTYRFLRLLFRSLRW